MLTATTNWLAANRKFEKRIVCRIVIGNYYRSFSNFSNEPTDPYYNASYPYTDIDDPWLGEIQDHDKNINDLQGGADQETLQFNIQDRNEKITADFPGFVFEGQLVQLYIGFAELNNTSDFLLYWQGYIDQVDSANFNLEYLFQCSDVTTKLQQAIYLIGDDGGQTSSANIKTLKGHPLQIMLDIFQNQLKDPLSGLALDPALVDTTKIQAYMNGPLAGFEFEFHLQQPPSALDFIKNQLLKPLGGYLWVSQGQLTVNFFYPLNQLTPVQTLGANDWLSIPTAEQTAMANCVQWQFDKDDATENATGNFLSTNTQEYGPSVQKYGLFGELNIASDGLRAALQGYLISNIISYLIFGRYGFKNLTFDKDAPEALWTSVLLEPGDLVAVTHTQIPNRKTGVMGITNYPFEILNKKTNFKEGKVTLTMIDGSYLGAFGFTEIAPDGTPSWYSATTLERETYMFQCGEDGTYDDSVSTPGTLLA
jgi:hypothetical protein